MWLGRDVPTSSCSFTVAARLAAALATVEHAELRGGGPQPAVELALPVGDQIRGGSDQRARHTPGADKGLEQDDHLERLAQTG
eukprot:CAMPEP_0183372990 /NCGR_PEP_ID=MMETSP0164_2-20130417/110075_1 /TAXON_ID=221442 /ORGANISM="Coccolithus pelagicus ssp braarudi, Strain PLY182g" /LENGTH=82 /DNA_ID=CAMNT_0025549785 /DNA_START=40 /DNA_END=283 /DNA_ORIENTATION=-